MIDLLNDKRCLTKAKIKRVETCSERSSAIDYAGEKDIII